MLRLDEPAEATLNFRKHFHWATSGVVAAHSGELIKLPGIYSLPLNLNPVSKIHKILSAQPDIRPNDPIQYELTNFPREYSFVRCWSPGGPDIGRTTTMEVNRPPRDFQPLL